MAVRLDSLACEDTYTTDALLGVVLIDPSGIRYAKKASTSKGELRQGSIISVLHGGSVSFGIVNAFMENNGHYGVSMSLISGGIKVSGQNGYFPCDAIIEAHISWKGGDVRHIAVPNSYRTWKWQTN